MCGHIGYKHRSRKDFLFGGFNAMLRWFQNLLRLAEIMLPGDGQCASWKPLAELFLVEWHTSFAEDLDVNLQIHDQNVLTWTAVHSIEYINCSILYIECDDQYVPIN